MSFDPLKLLFENSEVYWESTWECVGSFFHTFLYSREHEM
jgi:hypothetical protein